MAVSGVELFRYSLRFRSTVALKGARLHRREGALIRLTSDAGSEGWGEAAPLPGFSRENLDDAIAQLRTVAPALVGAEADADLLAGVRPAIPDRDRLAASVAFGLETALLNLFSGPRGEPALEARSGQGARTIPVNGLLTGNLDEVLGDARRMKSGGYRAVKLKVGGRNVAGDVEVVRRVREVLGGGVSLRLDANRAWGFEEALEFGRGVVGTLVAYVEEPLAEVGRLRELAGVWGLPVALDESLVGMAPEELGGHAYAGAIVLKPTLLGGVSRTLRFAAGARALGMAPVVSSTYEGGVGTAALAALAAAVGGEPAGLDTYRRLAEDVIGGPLALPAPELDVRGAVEAARGVDVGRLEPVALR